MSEEKARRRERARELMRQYNERERRQRRILWGLFYAVMVFFLGVLAYAFMQPGKSGEWEMPFIGERHRLLKENNPERK
jgi:polyferredoxin